MPSWNPTLTPLESIYINAHSGNRYRITWKHFWMVENTDCVIFKEKKGLFGTTKWEEIARIYYHERCSSQNSTSSQIMYALFDLMREDDDYKEYSNEIGDLDKVAEVIAQALKYNDDIALEVIREFNNCTPAMQLEAIFALQKIVAKEKELLQNTSFNNDYTMQSKINMIDQYYDIRNEFPAIY